MVHAFAFFRQGKSPWSLNGGGDVSSESTFSHRANAWSVPVCPRKSLFVVLKVCFQELNVKPAGLPSDFEGAGRRLEPRQTAKCDLGLQASSRIPG